MRLIQEINIPRKTGEARIQIMQGDLSAIDEENKVDILVVSAFPGSYVPTPGTLIGALHDKGLDVGKLYENREADFRAQLGCWLSAPLEPKQKEKFHIKRILCFEPRMHSSSPEEIVGNIFRCINLFAFDSRINVLATPIVATGNQKVSIEKMLPALLDAATFWLNNGLPLECIKLVVFSDSQVKEVERFLNRYLGQGASGDEPPTPPPSFGPDLPRAAPPAPPPVKPPKPEHEYDFFISYAHKNASHVNAFVESMLEKNKDLKIFFDKDSIQPGGLWIKQISDAIQKAKKVIIFLSPEYDNSPVCWDEFQCAKVMEYNSKKQIIQTIYLYNYAPGPLPPIMAIYSYIDCREGDEAKLRECISKLIEVDQA